MRGVWYCGSDCADGRDGAEPRQPRVPEPWLYARPRRFYRARKPKELKSSRRRFVSATQGIVNDQLVLEATITGMAL